MEILKDYGELISITLIPFILWGLGTYFQNRSAKRKAKEDLFLKLMANRKKNPLSQDWADALNQIDVVFQDSQKVRSAWRAYYDSLHPDSQHFSNQNSFQLDLMSEIAQVLGYRHLRQTEIDRFYAPAFFGNQMSNQDLIFREQLRVLTHSKNLAEPFSKKEYQKHLKELNRKA
ncbi:DUF6680 family protein [Parapedobacter soli]|uniref:DUF6680 family protein n=1 Tax=Parapedobacter soli TaxID=416955 RepID=UPI0036F261EF